MAYFYFLATLLISTCNILHIHRPEDKLIIFVSALQWLNNAISILILQVIIITRRWIILCKALHCPGMPNSKPHGSNWLFLPWIIHRMASINNSQIWIKFHRITSSKSIPFSPTLEEPPEQLSIRVRSKNWTHNF